MPQTLARGVARLRGDAGFTLPELLVSFSVLTIVMAGLATVLVSASRGEADLNSRFRAQESARLALTTLTRELHCASGVAPTSGTTTAIALSLPAGCTTGTGTITWCTVADGTTYDLWRVPGGTCSTATAGSRRLAESLSNANVFTPDMTAHGGAPVLPAVSLSLSVAGGKTPYRLTDTIYLRNGARR
jgi:prepilin-type N-terminal cleavage/methylation domain-containing protein